MAGVKQLMFPPSDPMLQLNWIPVKDGDPTVKGLFDRHYSRRRYRDGREPKLFVGPGEKMVLRTAPGDAMFVWRLFMSMDRQAGLNCAVFRNEGCVLSSRLILEAEWLALKRWPGTTRFYTYVNREAVKSSNPGYCFIMAGWEKCGISKGGLLILHKNLPPPDTTGAR